MNQDKRDPGLQPERTSMSWFRTSLLIFANSLLFFLVGQNQEYLLLEITGGVLLLCAIVVTLYNKDRFSQLFSKQMTIGYREIRIKQALSLTVSIASASYGAYLLSQLFNI